MTIARLRRRTERTVKIARQWLHVLRHGRRPTRPVFVLGSQRSGTRLPLVLLQRAPEVITHSDGSTPFFHGVMLRDDVRVAQLLRRQPFPITVLKPICESHRALEFLQRFPSARIIWIFRSYQDAVNSASAKWSSGRQAIAYLAAGDLRKAAWRAGGVTPAKFALVRELYTPDMSLHSANAIMWFLRNSLYFDLNLDCRSDVLLVRYEDLAGDPLRHAPRLFDFVDCPFLPRYTEDVYASSVGKTPFPTIPQEIERLCRDVHDRLIDCYLRQLTPSSSTLPRQSIR